MTLEERVARLEGRMERGVTQADFLQLSREIADLAGGASADIHALREDVTAMRADLTEIRRLLERRRWPW